MRLNDRELLVCNCEGTMPLDGDRVARACGATGNTELSTQLCRAEAGRFQAALAAGLPVLVACTQEAATFDEMRTEAGSDTPVSYVNIRETAGWSTEAESAYPKIAALLAAAQTAPPAINSVALQSGGVALIYGRDETAIAAARQLADRLDVTVMLDRPTDIPGQPQMDIPIVQGRIRGARGYLGAFELVVDDYAVPSPASRQTLRFGRARQGASSRCDIIIDLTGGTPLFPAPAKRDGYLRADPKDPAAVQRILFAAADLVGEFEKPVYVTYHEGLCAHSRSRKTGCTRCLDVCPTGAITPAGDRVAFDPFICAGCGSCGAVCPSGAAEFRLPPAADLSGRVRGMLEAYTAAGGSEALLLVHDQQHGAPLLDALARFGNGLPARVLPLLVHSVTGLGIDFFASAFAFGAAQVCVLAAPRRDDLLPLAQSIGLSETVLTGLGHGQGRAQLIECSDPDALAEALAAAGRRPGVEPARHLPIGSKRDVARQSLRHLHRTAPEPVDHLALAAGAPFGNVVVNAEGCTLCLACVSSCPTGALSDDPDHPRLSFTEDACVQCGLCRATCPEKVIILEPRLNFTPQSAQARVMKEEEPYACIRCAKPFGTRASVERIAEKLGGRHWMFSESRMIDRIRMCADCRVIAQSENALDPYAGTPRPDVRTTEDYLAERAAREAADKPKH